jgi:hypothetical protein
MRCNFKSRREPGRGSLSPYYFDVRSYGEQYDYRGGTLMPDDDAALDYARRLIRDLRAAGGYDDPALTLIVRNSAGTTVFSIPFTQPIPFMQQ